MALKQDFVTILRSGQFEQITDGRLRSAEGVCALGALGCVLAIREGLTEGDKDLFLERADFLLQFIAPGVANKIAEMNDLGIDFEHIARWIETNLNDDLGFSHLTEQGKLGILQTVA